MDREAYLEKLRAAISDCFPEQQRFQLWIVGGASLGDDDDPSLVAVETVFDGDSLPKFDSQKLAKRIARKAVPSNEKRQTFRGDFDGRHIRLTLRTLS